MDHNGVVDNGWGWKDAYGNDARIGYSNHTPPNIYGNGATFDHGYGVLNEHGYEINPAPSSSSDDLGGGSNSMSFAELGCADAFVSKPWTENSSPAPSDGTFFQYASTYRPTDQRKQGEKNGFSQGLAVIVCFLVAIACLVYAVENWRSATQAKADVSKMHAIAARRSVLDPSWHDAWKREEDHLSRLAVQDIASGKAYVYGTVGFLLVGVFALRGDI